MVNTSPILLFWYPPVILRGGEEIILSPKNETIILRQEEVKVQNQLGENIVRVQSGTHVKLWYSNIILRVTDAWSHNHDTRYYTKAITDMLLSEKVAITDIVNNLTTNDSEKPLSAAQGLVLKWLIDQINTLLTSDNVNLDNVQELVDAIETIQMSLSTILVNDLVTGGATKALTAEQGKVLKGLIDDNVWVLIIRDTKQNILDSTPEWPCIGLSTDTEEKFIFYDSIWYSSSEYYEETNWNPSIGAWHTYNVNDVGRENITDKTLSNVRVRGYNRDLWAWYKSVGAIDVRYNEDTDDYELSLWSTKNLKWRRILSGIFIEKNEQYNTLISRDYPMFTIDIFSGNSIEVDSNGTPMVQQGKLGIGALQYIN